LRVSAGLWRGFPKSLSAAPFQADCLFGTDTELWGARAYLPPCMNAFVGADITCAVLASGMCQSPETALLCDLGTNGELALWSGGRLYVASTAAGLSPGAVEAVYLAGGFGRCLNVSAARKTGLLPESLTGQVQVLGNAALAGAARILLNQEDRAGLDSIARLSTHVSLGGDPRFNERYVENMLFPEGESGAGL